MSSLWSYAADLLLMTASLGAAAYCMVLSRRLTRLGSFDKGIGSAIAVLSAQVEEMKVALGDVRARSDGAGQHLDGLVKQAREISSELEMMIAACHDFAEAAIEVQAPPGEGDAIANPGAGRVSDGATGDKGRDADAACFVSSRESPAAETPPVFESKRHALRDGADELGAIPVFLHRAPRSDVA